MEPGLLSLHPWYPIPATLEYPTYHFCKTRPLHFQDEIKLPTLPFGFVRRSRLLRSRDNRDQARQMRKLEWLVPDRL